MLQLQRTTQVLPCVPTDTDIEIIHAPTSSSPRQVRQHSSNLDGWFNQKNSSNLDNTPPTSLVSQPPAGFASTATSSTDALEAALSTALAEYRYRAEEILDEHRKVVEEKETVQQMDMAKLRAENALMRERLNLSTAQAPDLFQTVCFEQSSKDKKGNQDYDDGARKIQKDNCCDTIDKPSPTTMGRRKTVVGDMLKGRGGQQPQAAKGKYPATQAGRWEQFVAWVPMGAALQNPTPWKPLEDGLGAAEPVEEKNSNGSKDEEYQLLEAWKKSKEEEARAARKRLRQSQSDQHGDCQSEAGGGSNIDEDWCQEKRDRCTIHPHSTYRILWDMLSLFMTIYDMIMIPMGVFVMDKNGAFLKMMEWVTRCFWTVDMPISCLTGVVKKDGSVNMEIRFIIKRYAMSWFILDILIVGSDWGEFIYTQGQAGGGAGAMKISRVLRASRAVRLLRLAKMKAVINAITERIQSDNLMFILQTLKLIIILICFAHLIACFWWGIGTRSSSGTWVAAHGYAESTVDNQYLVSLHWALAQFSGGMDEVYPLGALERFFACIIWTFAFTTASIILSMMTSNLTQMHIVGGNSARQLSTLRKYLKQNDISSNLTLRMQRSASHAMSGDLIPDLVDLLHVVAEPLRVEMHFEMFSDTLRKHQFFGDFIIESPVIMRKVCHYVTSPLLMSVGDVVFSEGEAAADPKMYFIVRGTCHYVDEYEEVYKLDEGEWLAEGSLWANWTYKGTLTAVTDCKFAVLDAKIFQDLVKRFKDVAGGSFDPRMYAVNFVRFLNETEDVNDLSIMDRR